MFPISSLSLYEALSLTISAGGFLTIVGSILLLLRQTRELARQTQLIASSSLEGSFDRLRAQMFTIDEIFLSQPDLRPYFYEGRRLEEGDDLLRQRVSAAAETILDVFEVVVLNRKYFTHVWPQETWDRYITHVFAQSPFLCEYLGNTASWFPGELTELMRRGEFHRAHSSAFAAPAAAVAHDDGVELHQSSGAPSELMHGR